MSLTFAWRKSALALLAAVTVIGAIVAIALFGNPQHAAVQPVQSCSERVCGEYALLDCNATGGGWLTVYTQPEGRFLAECDASNPARLSSQPLCAKVFEALKSCPAK